MKTLFEKTAITSQNPTRLLFLDGEKGSVACRVHGYDITTPLPHLSPEHTIETSFRSHLRLRNLIAVRGVPGKGMVGPADYYGNWENPSNYSYTIEIENGFPTIYQHAIEKEHLIEAKKSIRINQITEVSAIWTSGSDIEAITKKRLDYHKLTGDSLFKKVGVLEIDTNDDNQIELKSFDATKFDLTPFKARLVSNNLPFKITSISTPINTADEWRAVSYHYEEGYARKQVKSGGGLFLETHDFPQSITPLDENSGGFVTLAKWKKGNRNKLELIGIYIPYGYTLIIEKGCIHGDTDLVGMFMMCMTSNHVTMSSADTVFLKNPKTKNNITIVYREHPHNDNTNLLINEAKKPYVIYEKKKDLDKFNQETKDLKFMFNPLSKGWREKITYDMKQYNRFFVSRNNDLPKRDKEQALLSFSN